MNTTLVHRFAKGLHLFFIATLLAGLAIMATSLEAVSPARAGPGDGPWVITTIAGGDPPAVPGAIYAVDTASNTLYGPFLQGQLGTVGGGRFDVAITPDCSTALVSNFGDSMVFFVDVSVPTNPHLLGSVTLPFFAEDIAITPNGMFAVVSNGGFSPRLASIHIPTRKLVETEDLGNNYANAVAIAPNGTVIVADYFSAALHTLTIDGAGNLTPVASYPFPVITIEGTDFQDMPVNVAVACDGQTVLVMAVSVNWVSVFRITGPGTLAYTGRVFGLPPVWDDVNKMFHGSQQSVAFGNDGRQAYVLTNGRTTLGDDPVELPNQISVLDILSPGQVSLHASGAATLSYYSGSQLFGVDVVAVAGAQLYVGNPTLSGGVTYLSVVDLTDYSVTDLPVGELEEEIPVGVAACPDPCPALVPIGGIAVPVNKSELLAPWAGLAALASLTTLTIALVRRRRSA